MVILIEKGKIKSIARRVMSSHILGVWIPDYHHQCGQACHLRRLREEAELFAELFSEQFADTFVCMAKARILLSVAAQFSG